MKIFTEKEAEDFLEKEGFSVPKRLVSDNFKQILNFSKKLKYPVALKVQSSKILHKSDVGGVKLDIRNEEELNRAFNELKKIKNYQKTLVQKFVKGHFLLLGLKKDSVFGHAITVGLGGIYTEVFKDISFRICPISEKQALEMLNELKIYPILKGARGEKSINFKKLIKVLVKLSNLPKKHPCIKELDINPLIVNDKSAEIVDARIIFD